MKALMKRISKLNAKSAMAVRVFEETERDLHDHQFALVELMDEIDEHIQALHNIRKDAASQHETNHNIIKNIAKFLGKE